MHPRVRVACCADDKGTEIVEVRVTWSGGCRGGRSIAEDGCIVEITGIPKALVTWLGL